jgi:hypothetical protein
VPNYGQSTSLAPLSGLMRGVVGYSFGVPTAAAIAASPTGLVRAATGIVTLTTSAAHNFQIGNICTIGLASIPPAVGKSVTSVGGTNFEGAYTITAIPSVTTATLVPISDILLHQVADTGGTGTATSIAYETPAAPQAGQAFALNSTMLLAGPLGFAVDGKFSASPGVFEVDVQVADVDADANYQTISNGNVSTVDTTNFTFHFDCTWVVAKFARLRLVTRTNSVGFVGSIRG